MVALLWLWVALLIANFYPLVDGGFKQIWIVLRGLAGKDLNEKDSSGATTPREGGGEQHDEPGKAGEVVDQEALKVSA